ncbi:MAG: alginate export family protein [Prevotella sp.]|nr:alginate export family protein [Prevotella sp.]
MNHKLKILGSLLLLLLPATTLMAQNEAGEASPEKGDNVLNVNLQMLSHGEMRMGGLDASSTEEGEVEDKAYFMMERSRLTVDYQRTGLETKVVAQHQGIWGQKGQGSFNLYEAWAKLSTKNGLFAQIGRQALSYDDERIIGVNDWAMAASSHDVIRTGYEGHGHKAHLILGFNQNAENTYGGTYYKDGSQVYKTMLTTWYHYDIPQTPIGASLLFMNIGMQGGELGKDGENGPHDRYQQLLGTYWSYSPKNLKVEASYYRQMGRNENNGKIKAWMASAKAQLQVNRQLGVVVGYDYLSGDDYLSMRAKSTVGTPRHEIFKAFSSVYGSHHKFYGMMDFFYVKTYLDEFSPGLQNLYAGMTYSPVKALNLKMTYHYLATATELKDYKRTLGHDMDIEASYQIMKDARLSFGFSYMTGTETMQKLKLADENSSLRWGWFSLIITPRLFTTRW